MHPRREARKNRELMEKLVERITALEACVKELKEMVDVLIQQTRPPKRVVRGSHKS